jgi:hypothetical protein
MALEPFEQRTNGVNYDPELWLALDDAGASTLTSAPMSFQVDAIVGGNPIRLEARLGTCGSGCRRALQVSEDLITPHGSEVVIVRFAKFGETQLQNGVVLRWLVVMDENETLAGPLTLGGTPENPSYPARLELSGRMLMTVQIGDGAPVRLRARSAPILSGPVPAWPPYGMTLKMSGEPVDYYLDADIANPAATPFLTVVGNTVELGTSPHPIIGRAPKITSAARGEGGVELAWTATANEVPTSPPIAGYHVYRNDSPGDVTGWLCVARVPISTTSWIDTGSPRGPVEYLMMHAARCPFGYDLEGFAGPPVYIAGQ